MTWAEDSLSVGHQVAVRLLRVLVLAARDLRPISCRAAGSPPGVARWTAAHWQRDQSSASGGSCWWPTAGSGGRVAARDSPEARAPLRALGCWLICPVSRGLGGLWRMPPCPATSMISCSLAWSMSAALQQAGAGYAVSVQDVLDRACRFRRLAPRWLVRAWRGGRRGLASRPG